MLGSYRMRILPWISFWPSQVHLLLCVLFVEVMGPATSSSPNEVRNKSLNIQINATHEFHVGYGNDPFGDKISALTHGKKRSKRSVVHLYSMVECATGCDPLSYKGYGCYCGFLGSGYAVDGIDRCCQMHDWCYDTSGCPMFLEYFVPYLWKCYRGKPLCGLDFDSHGACGQRLCHCDQLLARCLRKYSCPRSKAICTSSPWRLLQNVFML